MKLLIPGGAGYIGSHMVRYAQEHGHEVVVLDDFSAGHEWAVKDCESLRVNLLDQDKLSQLLKGRHFDGVIHFAAKSLVGESVKKPDLYYRNNVVGTLNLVNEMLNNDVNNLVFSSTAAIFGNPVTDKIAEDHPKNPINPYGQSKRMVEQILADCDRAYGLRSICLRYFNAAGASDDATLGEDWRFSQNLIPHVMKAVLGHSPALQVFGNDFPTPDGTGIRDYIHVEDLARAHVAALDYLSAGNESITCNVGTGHGTSVLEIIAATERISGKKVPHEIVARRPGDPSQCYADAGLITEKFDWSPQRNLDDIISSAYAWHSSHPQGHDS